MTQVANKTFEVYRYQLLPSTDKIQFSLGLDDEYVIRNVNDLIAKKNEIFERIIRNRKFKVISRRSEVIIKLEYHQDNLLLFRMAAKRNVGIYLEDFKKRNIPNFPNVWIIVNNDPLIQKIAIEKNPTAFYSTHAVADILTESINRQLMKYQLNLYLDGLKDKSEFWETIKKYDNKITWLRFDLIAPNMANISKSLDREFRNLLNELKSKSNSHTTALELHSPKDGTLNIDKDNKIIKSAVEYMNEGGGESRIRIKKMKKKIKTTEAIREIEIQDIVFESSNEELSQVLQKLLS